MTRDMTRTSKKLNELLRLCYQDKLTPEEHILLRDIFNKIKHIQKNIQGGL